MKILKKAKQVIKKLKNPWWRAKKRYTRYYDELPLEEKTILLESQHGGEMSGNIFYILRYLTSNEKYRGFKVCLSVRLGKKSVFEKILERYGIENVTLVVLSSDEYYRTVASAKYLINDNTFMPFFMKKEGQVYLNTWHGTPLKCLGRKIKSDAHSIGNAQRNFLFSDYILFPNAHTRDAILKDYMVENISEGAYVMSGYPRNEIFFDTERPDAIREHMHLEGKKLYAYMPTFRGTPAKGGTAKNTFYLNYFLYELDQRLEDDEILFVNLHPVAKKDVDFKEFKHIRNFPVLYETYDFLNACDVLVSDYSSVFFDYASGGKKVVLFTYDKEEYLRDRGMYLSIDDLPFPQVSDVDSLLAELRTEKTYNDEEFIKEYCQFESIDASAKLCDFVILGEDNGLECHPVPKNGKKNVLIYAGNLAGNGVTASLMSLLNTVDLESCNYYVTFKAELLYPYRKMLGLLPEGVSYIGTSEDMNLTLWEQVERKLFKNKLISAKGYMKKQHRRVYQGFIRNYGSSHFDAVIQFNGYEPEVILQFSTFPGVKTIFVHSDMKKEIEMRGNQRKDVLVYAYNTYDNVAVVTDDMIEPTVAISGNRDNIRVVNNAINYRQVLEKATEELEPTSYAKCNIPYEKLVEILEGDAVKFINIGRFSPEKGQDRLIRAFAKYREKNPDSYLFIIGGSSFKDTYNELLKLSSELGLEERVIMLMNMPNPYCVLNKCDFFVLSSHYEGFGLVLAEADILGKPVISVDIPGPRTFMQKYGGTLVEDSEDGIYEGMLMLSDGKIKPMGVDYEEYNNRLLESFYKLLS